MCSKYRGRKKGREEERVRESKEERMEGKQIKKKRKTRRKRGKAGRQEGRENFTFDVGLNGKDAQLEYTASHSATSKLLRLISKIRFLG